MATDGLTTTTSRFKPPVVPAAFFGIVLRWPASAAPGARRIGYGLLQALLLLRLLPRIMEQPFAASYWGFTFGATALATASIRMAGHGDTGAIAQLAPYLFAGANIAVGLIALGTLRLIVQRRLLSPAAPAAAKLGA
jgi:tellurite resistance protein TehA-like permease